MLEDYSNPVAFASAPLGSVLDGRTGRSGTSLRRSVTTPAKLEHPRASLLSFAPVALAKTDAASGTRPVVLRPQETRRGHR